MTTVQLTIEGMTCEHCVKSVTQGLSSLEGVGNVEVRLDSGQATVEYDESLVGPDALRAKIAEVGYRAT